MKAILSGLVSLFVLTSCLQEVGSGAPSATIGSSLEETDPSVIAFSESLHPLLVENCSTCHGDFQAPLFAYANEVKTSHDTILSSNLADLDSPSASRLVTKVASNHQCWTTNCAADALSLQTRITDWANGNDSSTEETTTTVINSNIVTLPDDLPDCNAPNSYAFALNVNDENVPAGTILGFDICDFDSSSYQVRELKIKSSVAVNIKGVHVLFNAVDFAGGGNTWPQVDESFAGGQGPQDPATVVRDNYFFVAKGFGLEDPTQGGPGKDTIQLQVEEIRNLSSE